MFEKSKSEEAKQLIKTTYYDKPTRDSDALEGYEGKVLNSSPENRYGLGKQYYKNGTFIQGFFKDG